jgi:iron complex outermembrane receptor protein
LRLEQALAGYRLDGVLFASVRGRRERNRAGGMADATLDADAVPITFRAIEPRPNLSFGPGQREDVDQRLVGLGAHFTWREQLEVNLGLEHSWYSQRVRGDGGGHVVGGDDRRVLGNLGVAFSPATGLRVYAGYAEGLEELGAAPFTAVNANTALAAATSTQRDFAIAWASTDTLSFIVGAFELTRPFADVDAADVFAIRGEQHNRGVEFSAVWRPTADVSVILGAVLQEPLLSSVDFDSGAYAPGQATTRLLLDADALVPAVPGLFVAVSAVHERGVRTNAENLFTLPSRTTLDLGLRYEFEAGGAPMQIELSVENAADEFIWNVDGGDGFTFDEPRTLTLVLTADF